MAAASASSASLSDGFPSGSRIVAPAQLPSHNATYSPPPLLLTLAIVNQNGRVLLGRKRRGFGEGYYNGFGGKVERGETIEEAAIRELQEEAGIVAEKLLKQGVLTFNFDDKPQPWEVHVFSISSFGGEPCETDEMSPQWFLHKDIPFEKMWKDDEIWYPHFLAGRLFKGEFFFRDTHQLDSYSFRIVETL